MSDKIVHKATGVQNTPLCGETKPYGKVWFAVNDDDVTCEECLSSMANSQKVLNIMATNELNKRTNNLLMYGRANLTIDDIFEC